jgi:tetratricopeptide (TPR) repeat protein
MAQAPGPAANESFSTLLGKAIGLLATAPARAEQMAKAALQFAPGQQQALQIIVAARRAVSDFSGAKTFLESMSVETPRIAAIQFERALLFAESGENEAAIHLLSRTVQLEPSHPQAWRSLGDCLLEVGDKNGGAKAYYRHFASLVEDLKMLEQLGALGPDQIAMAGSVLREYLDTSPTDLMALQVLGEVLLRTRQFQQAEQVFARALNIDPSFRAAQRGCAAARNRQTVDASPASAAPLSATLAGLAQLLGSDPERVAAEAREILDAVPGQVQALFLLTSAIKLVGTAAGAREILTSMAKEHPNLASIRYEAGAISRRTGLDEDAVTNLTRAVELEPSHAAAWRTLANALTATGTMGPACSAMAQHLRLSSREVRLLEGASAVSRIEDLPQAEGMLRQALGINPTDVFANRMLGDVLLRFGKLREAEMIFKRALEFAPRCNGLRERYAMVLTQLTEWKAANEQFEVVLASDPGNPRLEALIAANLVMLGDAEEGARLFEKAASQSAGDKVFWLNYAQAAKIAGSEERTIAEAYRKCLEIDPAYGAAWWGFADMKTYRFSPADIDTMRTVLGREGIADGPRCQIEFALGKALEDEGAYEESFEHYRRANALRRPYISYSADAVHEDVRHARSFFTRDFFSSRSGMGCPAPDPIFIVGMPRAGSTLIEQILASHPLVEGTMELPDLGKIVAELIDRAGGKPYPALLADFDGTTLRGIGEEYLARTLSQRKLGRPFFTDKAGKNFFHATLIHLVLPNAKIVDARRHPLACGFSCFKQAFGPGALPFAYDQTDIGRYYRDYVEIMAHIDEVLPGRVHRVIHEDLVREPDEAIRRLLAYCDLPFDERCLRFHETERSIRTASSLQVRQPIRAKPREPWLPYDAWLQPMKGALGNVLTCYPASPSLRNL